jgi:uncharacterized protein YdaL
MPVFQGNTSGSVYSVARNIPCSVVSYRLYNKTGGSITVQVTIVAYSQRVETTVANMTLTTGQVYEDSVLLKVPVNASIHVISSGSVDYYFSIQ